MPRLQQLPTPANTIASSASASSSSLLLPLLVLLLALAAPAVSGGGGRNNAGARAPMALLSGRLVHPSSSAYRILQQPSAASSATAPARARRLSLLLGGGDGSRPKQRTLATRPIPPASFPSLPVFVGGAAAGWAQQLLQRRPLTVLRAAAGAGAEPGGDGKATKSRRQVAGGSAMGKAATTGGAGAKRGKSSTSSGDKVAAVEKEVLAALSIRGKAECITVPSAAADEVTLEAADDTIARALARLKLQAQDGKGPLHPYWHKRLAGLTRPAARALIPQLTHENALGFDAASGLGNGAAIGGVQQARRTGGGTLFDYVLAQKKAHPDKVILTRVGDFYETWGVDALMLVEYAGLNPMGNKAKAGCPYRNVQATLDGLTSAGLTVAVLEELSELDAGPSKGPGKQRLKTRVLAQVVSPGASTYLYDCCLRPDDVEFKENRPYVGLLRVPSGGFTLVEAFLDAKTVKVTERLTPEAVRMALQAGGIAEPVYTQGVDAELLRSLFPRDGEVERRELQGFGNENFHKAVLAALARDMEMPYLFLSDKCDDEDGGVRLIRAPPLEARPRPVYLSTALQIGLLPNANVPDLVRCLLPQQHWAHSARFLRRWLLTPPPYRLADAMQDLCLQLSTATTGPPQCRPVPVGKLVSMLSLRQCNVPLFRDLHGCVDALLRVVDPSSPLAPAVPSLRQIVAHESGLEVPQDVLLHKGQSALEAIGDVIVLQAEQQHAQAVPDDSPSVDEVGGLIPDHFFTRNEDVFRNAVRPNHPSVKAAYAAVAAAARRLCALVEEDFGPAASEIVVDQINNAVMLKKKPSPPPSPSPDDGDEGKGQAYVHPTDRNRKPIPKRYTTKRVEAAIGDYLAAVDDATRAVRRTLQELSDRLKSELPVLVTALHVAVVLQAAAAHVACARQKGWTLPELIDPPSVTEDGGGERGEPWTMAVKGLLPYWMPRGRGVENSVDLQGIFLLTAPNMAGKSTLMRALAVAALLGNCGLFVPCTGKTPHGIAAGMVAPAANAAAEEGSRAITRIPRFDNVFVRTASFDVPAEGKSAFALEMDDVRVLLRDCTSQSLILLDEIGKGTSSRDGAALSGALLEALDSVPVTAVFATHLHELFDLPLTTQHVRWKRMGVVAEEEGGGGEVRWSYQLEDGRCVDSMALHTARAYGIPEPILQRAQALGHAFDTACRPPSSSPLPPLAPSTPTCAPAPPTLAGATTVLQRLYSSSTAAEPDARAAVAVVAPGFDPSPALEGRSCVYLLCVPPPPPRTSDMGEGARTPTPPPSSFYVGETESVRRRLEQHRARFGPRIEAAVLPVASKSAARTLESLTINELKRRGYNLLTDADGQRRVSL